MKPEDASKKIKSTHTKNAISGVRNELFHFDIFTRTIDNITVQKNK